MLRRHLDRDQVLVAGQKRHLLGGRDMQHVDRPAAVPSGGDQPLGRAHGDLFVAPHRVLVNRGPVAHQGQALAQTGLVLGMDRNAPLSRPQDPDQQIVVLDQQAAGRRAHENLDAAAPGQLL